MPHGLLFHLKKQKNTKTPQLRCAAPVNSELYERASSFIAGLEAGEDNCLPALYPMVLSKDRKLANMAAQAIHAHMKNLDAPKIIDLSRRFCIYTSMEWFIDWSEISLSELRKSIDSPQAFLDILRLGTFHPNGYFRENCIRAAADDKASLPYIVLRLNDWVKPVREAAYGVLSGRLKRLKTDTAIEMLPYLCRTKLGERYDQEQFRKVEEALTEKILSYRDDISPDRIADYPPITRRFLYRILLHPDILSRSTSHRLLEREKNGNEKALILSMILKHYECGEEELDLYSKNKNPLVRKKALELRYERTGGAWEGLEQYLLDRSGGIRSDVCYILCKHTSFDILSFYRARLHTPDEAIAILGIGENGTAKDQDLLAEYLKSGTPKILKYTMRALSSLGAVGFEEDYWHYLHDTDVTISRAAYGAICKSGIRYGSERLYRSYQSCENNRTGKYLLYLLIHEPSWQRLPYLLLLYRPDQELSCPEQKRLQMLIRRALWADRGLYAKITKKHADRIIQIMDTQAGIPDGLKKSILFDLAHITIV